MKKHIKIPKLTDTMLVSFHRESPTSEPILLIGRKRMNESMEIINAFKGQKAIDIYNSLTEKENSYE